MIKGSTHAGFTTPVWNSGAMHPEAARLVETLRLEPHPEGGFYRETFRSATNVTTARGATRSAQTSILFLLTTEDFSAFHKLASDEAWHFYRGHGIALELIAPDGSLERRSLGPAGPWQTVVPAGTHFAARVGAPANGYALVGCDVSPGFEFDDFVVPSRTELLAAFPQHAALIWALTR